MLQLQSHVEGHVYSIEYFILLLCCSAGGAIADDADREHCFRNVCR